ncbi:MAG: hypothetical protein LBE12_17355 [Planctomycetaceae bacterium]|nr:hypothetical protein [Planctomycetaceae bacterium]
MKPKFKGTLEIQGIFPNNCNYSAAILFFLLNPARDVKCITDGQEKHNRRTRNFPAFPKNLKGEMIIVSVNNLAMCRAFTCAAPAVSHPSGVKSEKTNIPLKCYNKCRSNKTPN